jgi:hypothetical protein
MRANEIVAVAALLGCVVALVALARFVAWLVRRRGERESRRLDLLAAALQDPTLDPATRAELLRAIARGEQGLLGWMWQRLQQPALWRALWSGTAWMGFVISGAALALGVGGVLGRWNADAVALSAAFFFGMLTLPLALRELAQRGHASAQHRGPS